MSELADLIAKMGQEVVPDESSLSHIGVKGMRWGVRKNRSSSTAPVGPESVSIRKDLKTGRLVTKGGGGHAPSDDALTAVAIRQKAKASGASSLSNKEMQTLISRMNLEAGYKKAMADSAPPPSKGKAFIRTLIKQETGGIAKGKVGPLTMVVQTIVKRRKAAIELAAKAAT